MAVMAFMAFGAVVVALVFTTFMAFGAMVVTLVVTTFMAFNATAVALVVTTGTAFGAMASTLRTRGRLLGVGTDVGFAPCCSQRIRRRKNHGPQHILVNLTHTGVDH